MAASTIDFDVRCVTLRVMIEGKELPLFPRYQVQRLAEAEIGSLVAVPESTNYALGLVLSKSSEEVIIGVLNPVGPNFLPYLTKRHVSENCVTYPSTWSLEPVFDHQSKPDHGGDLRYSAGVLTLDNNTYAMRFNADYGIGRSGGTYEFASFKEVGEPSSSAIPMAGWRIWMSEDAIGEGDPIIESPSLTMKKLGISEPEKT